MPNSSNATVTGSPTAITSSVKSKTLCDKIRSFLKKIFGLSKSTDAVRIQVGNLNSTEANSSKTRSLSGDNARIPAVAIETKCHGAPASSIETEDHTDKSNSSFEYASILETGTQPLIKTRKARLDIFSPNVSRPSARIEVPKIGSRITSTTQLALCSSLLPKNQTMSNGKVHKGDQDQAKATSEDVATDQTHIEWIEAIEKDIVEQDHIRWLGTCMVEEFTKALVKDSAVIAEIILLGPVLDREHYHKLLNCFISKFDKAKTLDVPLLQGLIQLIQCASEGHLDADDLIKILSILREKLQNTHQQSTEHPYHLTLALSRLLDVMAEHKVHDVKRVEEHEPLSEILSSLRSSSDPFLMYQASYAYQALQYVPDDETPLQAALRHSTGVANSLIKISGVVKLDLSSVLGGLKGFQEVIGSSYDVAKAGYDGFCSLMDSGRGVFDSLKEGLAKGHKRPWYPALRAAEGFLRQRQLADFNRLIVEASCRRDPLFQWGICQLIGEITVDEAWEATIRQQATDLLVDLYKYDMDWAQDESVKRWMLAIIMQLGNISDPAINDDANNLLDDLKKSGCSAALLSCPLKTRLPMPVSSPLLTRVQKITYVEYDLHQLQRQRLDEPKSAVYIPPMAKANQQARDSDVFPLMKKVTEFLASERQVMLILGDSGAGKSTFNRHLERELWGCYKSGGKVPLFINMPALSRPETELIAEQLRMHNFSDPQIQELKLHRELIVICDGYDESQLNTNLHTTNRLNQAGQWRVQLVVSCRSQYLGREYHDLFVPRSRDHYSAPPLHLFQEAVITPFSRSQIEDYVDQYVPLEPRTWVTKDYMHKLTTIPNLMDLVTNPFLLIISLGALPDVVQEKKDITAVRITRVALYDSFVKQWIGANKRRLENQKLQHDGQTALAKLKDNFERTTIEYQMGLAGAIFHKQGGKPVVEYVHQQDKSSWKAGFFGPEAEPTLLRDCSLLKGVGNQYRFIHRSILEYFYSRFVLESSRSDDGSRPMASIGGDTLVKCIADHPLSQRSFVGEPSIIQFLCERMQEDVLYKNHLLALIDLSKADLRARQAASNAITILVQAGVMFNGADLQDIRIPGADLSGGQFDSAQLQGADLRNTNLRNIWMRQADLSMANMEGAQFGERPFLEEDHEVESCTYSPDGKSFAIGLRNGTISLYWTTDWEKTKALCDHTDHVTSVVFSPSGQRIASGSSDTTVRLWDAQTGALGDILTGHTDEVTSVVFSPRGEHIASGSSDKTVRVWDAHSGTPVVILSGHADTVTSVAFSPCGQHIASGGFDGTVRIWDLQTAATDAILSGHTAEVTSVVFSPRSQLLASGSYDYTVRLWDAKSGAPGVVLRGHTFYVKSVAFSPDGQQIASGSSDDTVRLWDAQTGALCGILRGHTSSVKSVVFSPDGQQIASGSSDTTVRLWDAFTSSPGAITRGHTSHVKCVVFSPNGQQIASGSEDKTVRLWDVQTGAPDAILRGHTGEVTSVVFSPDGLRIASVCSDKTIRLWDAQSGAAEATLRGHTKEITSVVFSPSSQQIASGSRDKTVRLWNARTGALGVILRVQSGEVTSVSFSPCGQQMASVSSDKTVRLWDAKTGARGAILIGHTRHVNSMVFSPNGQQIASGSDDYTVRLWDFQTGGAGGTLSGHTNCVTSVVYSPSGKQIASGSYDQTVRLWDARTQAPGTILQGHTSLVMSVAFSPTGQQVVSGSDDKTVRLWDVESGQCLSVIKGFHGTTNSIAWSAIENDHCFVTGCDMSVRLWKVIVDRRLVQLRWSSMHDRLDVSDTNIVSVQGFTKMNMKFLEQRGAVSQPTHWKEP